jgi:FkbM family methyltransferase
MALRRRLKRMFFHLVPAYNHRLYEFCTRYVDRYNGDNNSDPETNGEYIFLRKQLEGIGRQYAGIIFDVGANIGDWVSLAFSINPTNTFHCFEPSKAAYDRLAQKRLPENVRINHLGLGEADEVRELYIVDEGSGMNSLYARRGVDGVRAIKKERISISTIDGYCERNRISQIDFLKVDVEGHELAVFKGMSRMMARGLVRVIQFEYGGCNIDARVHLGDIWHFLEPHGFRFFKLFPEGPRRMEKYQQRLETFKYSNWVAVLEDCKRMPS